MTCRTCGIQLKRKIGRGGRNRAYCDACHPRRDRVPYISALMPYKAAARQLVKDTHARLAARAEASPDNTVRRICKAKGCGTEFTVTGRGRHERRYCNETCRNRKHGSIDYPDETIACENCGTLVGKYDGSATLTRPRRFCSPACKSTHHSRIKANEQRARDRAKYAANPSACTLCGTTLPYKRRDNERCQPCQDKLKRNRAREYRRHRYETDLEYRSRCIDAAHRRHARKKTNGPIHNIKRREVFERDNYRCRICGTTTDETLPRYHPKRPELGHINAIAAGGTHTWDNVCCLCFACNRADGVNQLDIQTSIFDLT